MSDDGSRAGLDRAAAAYLERLAQAAAPAITELSPAEARAAKHAAVGELSGPTEAVGAVVERVIPGPVRLRVYKPLGEENAIPALVYLHRSGWVVGSLDSHDASRRALAART